MKPEFRFRLNGDIYAKFQSMGKNLQRLPEQDLLLPPSLRDWLPEDHFAYFVSDVVEQLDLSAIESVYEEEGARSATVPSADDDQDFDLWLLRWGVFLAADAKEGDRGCGISGVGSWERIGFPNDLGLSQAASGGAAGGCLTKCCRLHRRRGR